MVRADSDIFIELLAKWKTASGEQTTVDACARCAYELEDVLDRLDILPLSDADPRK